MVQDLSLTAKDTGSNPVADRRFYLLALAATLIWWLLNKHWLQYLGDTMFKFAYELSSELLATMPINELRTMIDKADSAYYRIGSDAIISDSNYDDLKLALKKLDPTDKRLTRIGFEFDPHEIGSKVKHKIPMGSLDNTDDGIFGYQSWYDNVSSKLNNQNPAIIASWKIDGASICASYENGNLVRVISRGNGEIGEDITANAVNFQNLPTVLPFPINCEVRGEAILYKKDFELICSGIPKEDRSNPRNVGNGILGRHDGSDSRFIRLLAFNIWVDSVKFATEFEKFEYIKELGFSVVPFLVCNTTDELNNYYHNIVAMRDSLQCEIDGIVVVLNDISDQDRFVTRDIKSLLRPKYARAIKFTIKTATSQVTGIDVTVGHTGAIIPTMTIATTRIGGVNVSNALLNNWDEVKRFDLAIGDTVTVGLSGDIIPKCLNVVERGDNRQPILEPAECPNCGSSTTRMKRGKPGAITYCSNNKCSAVIFGKINHWIGTSKKGVGILDIGDAMLQSLFDRGLIVDPADLYKLTVDDLKDVVMPSGVRIGESRAQKIVANISEKKKLSLPVFLGSLGIDLLGSRRVEQFIGLADGKLNSIEQWLDDDNINSLEFVGLGDAIRNAIRSGIDDNRDLIKKLLDNGVVIDNCSADIAEDNLGQDNVKKPLDGITMCWTGTRDLIEEAKAAGVIVKSGISKGLHVLVQLDPLSKTVKTQKAESYGTQIISVEYLGKLLSGKATRSDLGL